MLGEPVGPSEVLVVTRPEFFTDLNKLLASVDSK